MGYTLYTCGSNKMWIVAPRTPNIEYLAILGTHHNCRDSYKVTYNPLVKKSIWVAKGVKVFIKCLLLSEYTIVMLEAQNTFVPRCA